MSDLPHAYESGFHHLWIGGSHRLDGSQWYFRSGYLMKLNSSRILAIQRAATTKVFSSFTVTPRSPAHISVTSVRFWPATMKSCAIRSFEPRSVIQKIVALYLSRKYLEIGYRPMLFHRRLEEETVGPLESGATSVPSRAADDSASLSGDGTTLPRNSSVPTYNTSRLHKRRNTGTCRGRRSKLMPARISSSEREFRPGRTFPSNCRRALLPIQSEPCAALLPYRLDQQGYRVNFGNTAFGFPFIHFHLQYVHNGIERRTAGDRIPDLYHLIAPTLLPADGWLSRNRPLSLSSWLTIKSPAWTGRCNGTGSPCQPLRRHNACAFSTIRAVSVTLRRDSTSDEVVRSPDSQWNFELGLAIHTENGWE